MAEAAAGITHKCSNVCTTKIHAPFLLLFFFFWRPAGEPWPHSLWQCPRLPETGTCFQDTITLAPAAP